MDKEYLDRWFESISKRLNDIEKNQEFLRKELQYVLGALVLISILTLGGLATLLKALDLGIGNSIMYLLYIIGFGPLIFLAFLLYKSSYLNAKRIINDEIKKGKKLTKFQRFKQYFDEYAGITKIILMIVGAIFFFGFAGVFIIDLVKDFFNEFY
tara:strand:+ start:860 stop:1324 length:465 start_codon:yes stop_codon:yes gene_type:complete